MSYNILIVDFSVYKDSIASIFKDQGFTVETCESAYQAMSKLKAVDFDLVVSEVELPGDNSFDLYNYIKKNYPYIPAIMTTESRIDTFFDQIFEEGIGNVLCKPVKKDEILGLALKLITRKNIFGLNNYLSSPEEVKKISITSSKQIQKAINIIYEQILNWGLSVGNKTAFNLILNEMIINAVYHSHGFTFEKENRIPVKLPENSSVDIHFAFRKNTYAISITDYNGILTKEKILNSINNVILQDNIILKAVETGEDIIDQIRETGRGLDLVRKLTGEYYFIIKKGVRTEIILIFDTDPIHDDTESYSSLKIIEDYPEDT